jgi:CelD/BcsL family acetyltransferase involved in cellulose biosynthesis
MRIDVVRPSDLTGEERARWRTLQARAGSDYSSPFLSPDWAIAVDQALGRFRDACQVAVMREDDRAVGFFAARVGRAVALPAGAPLCDYQGVVAEAGLKVDPRRIVEAFGVQRIDFTHMVEHDRAFGALGQGRDDFYAVDVSAGWDAYEQGRREAGTDILKDIARKRRKLEREVGPLTFAAFSRSRVDFERTLEWKRAQFARTNQTDPTATPWVRVLLEQLFESRDPEFGGALFTLHAGDRLAAAQFNLRGGGSINAWFISHDEALERYSPGLVMWGDLLRWMAESPYRTLDLGPVAYRFKDRLANRTRGIVHGFAGRPGAATLVRAAEYGVRRAAEALPLGKLSELPGKAMRRLDRMRALG